MRDFVIVRNPDPGSRLPYLIRLPVGAADVVLRAGGTWPREKAIYCYPADESEWPACTKQARPGVSTPTARASGVAALPIVVDTGERYGYRFARQQVQIERRRLPAGDYAVERDGRVWAAVERKSLPDLVGSLLNSRLKYQLTELAALPRAAVVVEDRYSQVFKLDHVRPALVADGIAELQVAFPGVPIVFCETRKLAEEWTYRFLAAAYALAGTSEAGSASYEPAATKPSKAGGPTTADVRRWARDNGFDVSDRGRLRPEIRLAYERAHTE
ncbi:Lsr2 family protein [Microbispora sp. NBC_01189]|uniref:ERCC4 domain-containing protein n=1 Tax=Microbispora sp. NBC_01189 TaxID=2903583 RepID=UPI002E13FCD6|nr:Lsr2 family protein [Microbispora sp. NBC_01189]